jgi:hypothetical protein
MKHLQLKDCALLVGLNPEGNCVYSAAIALGEYWDGEHVWDSDKQVKKMKLQKVLGFLFGSREICCSSLKARSISKRASSRADGRVMKTAR